MRTRRLCSRRSSMPSLSTYWGQRGRVGDATENHRLSSTHTPETARAPARIALRRRAPPPGRFPSPAVAPPPPGARAAAAARGAAAARLDKHEVGERVEVVLEAQRHERSRRGRHAAVVEAQLGCGERGRHPGPHPREPVGRAQLGGACEGRRRGRARAGRASRARAARARASRGAFRAAGVRTASRSAKPLPFGRPAAAAAFAAACWSTPPGPAPCPKLMEPPTMPTRNSPPASMRDTRRRSRGCGPR
jgi:hypothetical protein